MAKRAAKSAKPVPAAPRVRQQARVRVRARYDAAQTTDDNRRHWSAADGLAPNASASSGVRAILRNRARYEVANNSYARGIVSTMANDTIGRGPRLKLKTKDAEVNRFVGREFASWAAVVGLATKLRTMVMARVQDGETFALLRENPNLPRYILGPDSDRWPFVHLDLRLIEAEQVTSPMWSRIPDESVDGIVFDRYGNPSKYHILRAHPGDLQYMPLATLDYESVPATQVLHYFRVDRPGQARGVSEIVPALPLFAQLRRYTLAVIAAAETAADFAAVIQSDALADAEDDNSSRQPETYDLIELEKRMATVLPSGWKLGQVDAKQPATTYAEFKREVLNEIARCLNIPYNIAACNSSSYNYASGRLDHQTYFRSIDVARSEIELVLLDRVFAAWLNEAILIDGYLPPAARKRDAEFSHQWFWDGREEVDQVKAANAQATHLADHTTTLAREYALQGEDWEDALEQRAIELKRMQELGIPLAVGGATQAEPDGAEKTEQAEETK